MAKAQSTMSTMTYMHKAGPSCRSACVTNRRNRPFQQSVCCLPLKASAGDAGRTDGSDMHMEEHTRRQLLSAGLTALIVMVPARACTAQQNFEPMEGLKGKNYGKTRMRISDYTLTPSGLQYKDLREGKSDKTPAEGNTVVVDWDGYTIGYYGRPFEARNKPKGGSFAGDNKDFLRFRLGDHKVIPAFEEALLAPGMTEGTVRRIVVPLELGYPDNDFNKLGPAPNTFSGQRTLDFVLKNQGLIDKTLLFDIELIKVLD